MDLSHLSHIFDLSHISPRSNRCNRSNKPNALHPSPTPIPLLPAIPTPHLCCYTHLPPHLSATAQTTPALHLDHPIYIYTISPSPTTLPTSRAIYPLHTTQRPSADLRRLPIRPIAPIRPILLSGHRPLVLSYTIPPLSRSSSLCGLALSIWHIATGGYRPY